MSEFNSKPFRVLFGILIATLVGIVIQLNIKVPQLEETLNALRGQSLATAGGGMPWYMCKEVDMQSKGMIHNLAGYVVTIDGWPYYGGQPYRNADDWLGAIMGGNPHTWYSPGAIAFTDPAGQLAVATIKLYRDKPGDPTTPFPANPEGMMGPPVPQHTEYWCNKNVLQPPDVAKKPSFPNKVPWTITDGHGNVDPIFNLILGNAIQVSATPISTPYGSGSTRYYITAYETQ